MWDILLWIGAGLWILFFVQMVVNLLLADDLGKLSLEPPERRPSVSIVVPARNEERAVREAVSSFCRQDYPDLEVVVVDDRSTDATPRILGELRAQFANLTVLRGDDPPPGWLGKPNALEAGRRAARGEWILFADADVVYRPDLLRRAMAYVLRERAAMLCLPPRFVTRGLLEPVILSGLLILPFVMVPLFLVNRTRSRFFAAGGGTFALVVRRDALEAAGAFASLKDAVADDIALGYAVKGAGFSQAIASGASLMHIRMYEGAAETFRGFTKNAFPLLKSVPWVLPLMFAGGVVTCFLPYIGFAAGLAAGAFSVPSAVSLVLMHVVAGTVAAHFRMPWFVAFFNPLRELCWWWILVRSAAVYYRHGICWRGRRYP